MSVYAQSLPVEDDSVQPESIVRKVSQHRIDNSKQALRPKALQRLPLGSIRPQGWLLQQLDAQAQNLTGKLEACWPQIGESQWKGGDNPAYYSEAGVYYLDGLIPLAYSLDDPNLKAKAQVFVEWILASRKPDGRFGATDDHWPLAVALKALAQYYEATEDQRVIELASNYFRFLASHEVDFPLNALRGVRTADTTWAAEWLHDITGEQPPLAVVDSIALSTYNWEAQFLDFPWTQASVDAHLVPKHRHRMHRIAHGVSIALALKRPAMLYRLYGHSFQKRATYTGLASLDQHHGQIGGRYSTDEHISGTHPSQGTELCATVDLMASMAAITEILGDPAFADRLESLAYNSLPGSVMPDLHAHQYHSQANQIRVSSEPRQYHSGGKNANIYGFMPSYPCCLANYHHGWPKFASHLWMATPDKGMAAIAYAPCEITTVVGNNVKAKLTVKTDYPFHEDIEVSIHLEKSARFPLKLRIPQWADNALVYLNDSQVKDSPKAGTFFTMHRSWHGGDKIRLHLPMSVRTEQRVNKAFAVLRGPLYFSLRIKKDFRAIKIPRKVKPNGIAIEGSIEYPGVRDWEVYPQTPWNYALVGNSKSIRQMTKVTLNPLPRLPFADRGEPVYNNQTQEFETFDRDPAVILTLRATRLSSWIENHNSAAAPPLSPVATEPNVTEIQLIPYGAARLRITEFPWTQL